MGPHLQRRLAKQPRKIHFLVFLGLGALCLLSFANVWRALSWRIRVEPEFNYVIALPVVMGLLIWVRRDRVASSSIFYGCRWVGVLLIVVAIGLNLLAQKPGMPERVWFASALIAMLGSFVAVWGVGLLRAGGWPLWTFLLLIPFFETAREAMRVPLERGTAVVTSEVLRAFGVGVERFGSLLTINGVPVNVAEACSGTRMLMSVGLAVYAYVFLHPLRSGVRVLVLALMPVIALLCNIVRVVASVAMYGVTNETVASIFHDWSAWGMMVLAYLICLWTIALWEWMGFRTQRDRKFLRAGVTEDDSTGQAAEGLPATRRSKLSKVWWLPAAVTAVLLLPPAWTQYAPQVSGAMTEYHAEIRVHAASMSGPGPGWLGVDEEVSAFTVNLLRPHVLIQRRYTHQETGETFLLALVHCERVGDLGSHHPPACYGGSGWQINPARDMIWETKDFAIPGNEYTMRRMNQGQAEQIQVNNTFMLPNLGATREHAAMLVRKRGWATDVQGAAQWQWLFGVEVPYERRHQLIEQFLQNNSELIGVLMKGPSS